MKVVPIVGLIALTGCESTTNEHYNENLTLEPAPESPAADRGWEPISPVEPAASPSAEAYPQQQYTLATPTQTYVIRRGDTLWSIATRVYNNGQRWRDIQAANPGIEPTKLRVGQEIMLP